MRLFNRSNRSIRITEAGEQLLGRIVPAPGEITAAIKQVGASQARPAGKLRLNVPRNAAEMIIKPLLARFLETYPDVRLEITTQDGLVGIVA